MTQNKPKITAEDVARLRMPPMAHMEERHFTIPEPSQALVNQIR